MSIQAEAERLRAAGFVFEIELEGRPLWHHPDYPSNTYWHEDALVALEDMEGEGDVADAAQESA